MSARKGLRRAQVLAVLGSEPKKASQIAKETGLKWQIVENVLDAPSLACLLDIVPGQGIVLRQTADALLEQAEAQARVSEIGVAG